MFAAIAAMEYVYWKNSGELVDLSEEFTNHVGKMFWLHADWPAIEAGNSHSVENQIGGTAGGEYLGVSADGLAIPRDSELPYRDPLAFSPPLEDPLWLKQYQVNAWNLSERSLPRAVLNGNEYYQATGYRKTARGSDPAEVEAILDSGFPMVWDFSVKGDITLPIWQPNDRPDSLGGHSTLIVGYNNRGSSDSEKFFWVKNSWGATSGEHGLTKVSYAYYKAYGTFGHTITGVRKVANPGYRYMGRWRTRGVLADTTVDITHLPGVSKSAWTYFRKPDQVDKRIGIWHATTSDITDRTRSYRINGSISNRGLYFHYDNRKPNQAYWLEPARTSVEGWVGSLQGGSRCAGFLKTGTTCMAIQLTKDPLALGPEGTGLNGETLPGRYALQLGDLRGEINVEPAPVGGVYRLNGSMNGRSYSGTLQKRDVAGLMPAGAPMELTGDLWFFDLTGSPSSRIDENAPTKIQLIGDKSDPRRMHIAGLSTGSQGFMLYKR